MNANGHRDVRIVAPAAHFMAKVSLPVGHPPTPEELVQLQQTEIRRLSAELEQLRITANTIANTTVALVYMLQEERGGPRDEVRIPRELRERLDGHTIQVRSEPEDTVVTFLGRSSEHVWDGRADG